MTWDFTVAGTSVKTIATITSFDGILTDASTRGDDLLIPERRGQGFLPKPYDAYVYPVNLALLGTSQGQLQDNLDALRKLCASAYAAVTFGRTTPRSGGDLTCSHSGTAGVNDVAMVNGLVTGRVVMSVTNLDGCWYGASVSPTIPATLTVAGTKRTHKITLVLPGAGTLTNTSLGVSVTVTAAATLTVDTETTTGSALDVVAAGDPLDAWFTLAPGSNVITWSGSGTPTITYSPAYSMSKVRVHVYDTTGATYQGTLKNATAVRWTHPLAGEGESAGNATFSLMAADAQASQLVRDRIVKMHWHGAIRVGFRIHRISRVLTDQGFRLDVTAIQLRCLLGDAVALGDYGLRVGAGETRRFGFMSPAGTWLVSSEWVAPGTTPLSSYHRWPAYPTGYPDAGSSWLAPPTMNTVGYKTWYRKTFTTTVAYKAVRLYVVTDDAADVYLDGELVMQIPSSPNNYDAATVADVPLPVGDHVLAVEMRDEFQWSGEQAIGELLCCLASVTASTSTTDPDAVKVTSIIVRSDSGSGWKVRYGHADDPGWRKAQVVKQLFTEASARGVRGCAALTLDFTDTVDTSGASWSDRGDYEVQTLSDLLDRIAESLFDPSIDWDVDAATMKVQAWNRRGTNRTTGTPVVLALRSKRTDLTITETYDVVTSLYGRTADGLVVHQSDSTAQTAAGGVVEAGMSLGSVASTQTATDLMSAHLDSLGYVSKEVTAALSPTGPVAYVDYQLGDTVAIPDGQGHYLAVRVLAITVDASGDTVVAVPDLAVDRTVTL